MSTPIDLASIHATAERCKAEGVPLAECAIRRLVKTGGIPSVWTGRRALVYWPNVLRFIERGNGPEPPQEPAEQGAVRRIGM